MHRIRTPRSFLALAALVVAGACSGDSTGSPPPEEAVVYGRVTNPDGAGVAGAVVRVEQGPAGCQPWVDYRNGTTGANGAYRMTVFNDGSIGGNACRRVFALAPEGSGLRGSDTIPLTVQFRSGSTLDSARVDLVLRRP